MTLNSGWFGVAALVLVAVASPAMAADPLVLGPFVGTTPCAAGGTYTCPQPDIFPPEGQLYMNCSLAESANHVPSTHDDW